MLTPISILFASIISKVNFNFLLGSSFLDTQTLFPSSNKPFIEPVFGQCAVIIELFSFISVKKETREREKKGRNRYLLFFSLLYCTHKVVFKSRFKEVVGRILREREKESALLALFASGRCCWLFFSLSSFFYFFTRCQHHHHHGVAKEGFDGLQNALKIMVRIEIIVCFVCRVGKKESSDARR